ncbi:uncharacterized protein LOC663096 [Tribolium castaneum]|uniref:X-ray repair cross-complementing protein 5-like Protein n=1 Tax=Tribolium castaneum TaxID=7070 RepID=D6WLA5_TRICA|nr:PREDICTED: uncharacterized protein LOC663096 [Tribolium castaneum]EFA03479.1 X-ray repair cross-complementing protein 5-like Protein [Tribolium castaneum]|eukprot:XP_974250.1 PREDICTED: uncharacterized protein LOC663096 [Tribolium castaneum]
MPPAAKRHCSVILFDLKGQNRLGALQTLLKISSTNFFSRSKDLTKLILLNSDKTENRLNARHGGYEHVNEVTKDVLSYNPKKLHDFVESSGVGEGNWLEGLHVAAANLVDEFEGIKGIITYQLLFITDLGSPLSKVDNGLIDKIARLLDRLGAFLYVVGPEIEPPFTIKTPENIKTWMENLQTNDPNIATIKTLISKIQNGVVCGPKIGTNLFFSYRNSGGSQPWNVPLGIGTNINIPAQTMKILNDIVQCKLVSAQGAIRPSTWIDAEDESIEFDASEVISGVSRHGKFVPVNNKMFQVSSSRSFSVLCFTDAANVPEHLMRGGGCYSVLPNASLEKNDAFNCLIDCLAQQNKYVIARRVYNNNYVPKIVVLVPKPDYNPKCFVLTALPFADDVRLNCKEQKVDLAPKIEENKSVYKLLDGLDTDNENSVKKAPLDIKMVQNVNVQRIVNAAVDKLLDKHINLEETDLDLMELPSGEYMEELKNSWPERKIEEVKKNEEPAADISDDDFDWE